MSVDSLIDKLCGDPEYVKFLLVERPRIRSAIEARPPLPDEESRVEAFSTTIGNPLHNELIELEQWLDSLAPQDRDLLLDWAEKAGRQSVGSKRIGRRQGGSRAAKLIKQYADRNTPLPLTKPSEPSSARSRT